MPIFILQNQEETLTFRTSNNLNRNRNINITQYFINNQIPHNETY